MLRALGILCSLVLAAGLTACSSSDQTISVGPNFATLSVYVTNTSQNAVFIFGVNPTSASTPINQIGGSNTQLNGPQYDTFDSLKHLYVSNYNSGSGVGSITEFASQATGNVLPIAQIGGSSTGIGSARGIAVDPIGNIYLANVGPSPNFVSSILFFSPGSSGNVNPFSFISGSATGLNFPTGIALDGALTIYAANAGNGTITEYANTSAGNTPPTKTIGGPLTGLVAPSGVALDTSNNVYVVDSIANKISVFASGTNGNVAPTRTISGAATTLNNASDIKLDSAGNIYVTNTGSSRLLVFSAGASGNVAPAQSIPISGTIIGVALSP